MYCGVNLNHRADPQIILQRMRTGSYISNNKAVNRRNKIFSDCFMAVKYTEAHKKHLCTTLQEGATLPHLQSAHQTHTDLQLFTHPWHSKLRREAATAIYPLWSLCFSPPARPHTQHTVMGRELQAQSRRLTPRNVPNTAK